MASLASMLIVFLIKTMRSKAGFDILPGGQVQLPIQRVLSGVEIRQNLATQARSCHVDAAQ
ncbi:hypothetical protein [Bradyrhizobium hipponense]|uniref:hypothetical protein n=1 Tax=Bradyrhizobium hipponense TaxID=2605638 RepID=UPI001652D75A|nr:hypothetical protein [Bradyrhizobium hipponense]